MPEPIVKDNYRVALLEVSDCCGGNVIEILNFDNQEKAQEFALAYNKNPATTNTPGYKAFAKYLGKSTL